MEEVIQVTQSYKMLAIFNTKNMRALGEFRGLNLEALKLTPACKSPSLITHRFSCLYTGTSKSSQHFRKDYRAFPLSVKLNILPIPDLA